MKPSLLASVALLAALAVSAFDKVSIPFQPKTGTKWSTKVKCDFGLGGQNASMVADVASEVTKSDEKTVEIKEAWSNLEVLLEGSPINAEAAPGVISLTSAMTPTTIGGGLSGIDAAQWFLATHFQTPAEKEFEAGFKYVVKVDQIKDQVPAYKFEGEYVGKEDLNGKSLHKFKGDLSLSGDGAMKAKQVAWIQDDGTLVKLTSDYTGMDIPIASAKADGKIVVTLKP